MFSIRRSGVFLLILLVPVSATAADPPARYLRELSHLHSRTVCVVPMRGGEICGSLLGASDTELRVQIDGVERRFAADDVYRVDVRHREVLKGIEFGAPIGAAITLLGGIAVYGTGDAGLLIPVLGGGGALGGAIWGAGIGALMKSRTAVYRRAAQGPNGKQLSWSPVLTPSTKAMIVSMRF